MRSSHDNVNSAGGGSAVLRLGAGRPRGGTCWPTWTATVLLIGATVGCSHYNESAFPEPIHQRIEPDSGTPYLLYAPSNYEPTQAWPLVVVCHGAPPWDSPRRLIGGWADLAEEQGFVVVAPTLSRTGWNLRPSIKTQLRRQSQDEQVILGVVRHVRGGFTISADRIFLAGRSTGALAVLDTGLKHPDLFRALAVLQGRFDSLLLNEVASHIDPYQPVFAMYSSFDLLVGSDGDACIDWLSEHGAAITAERAGGGQFGAPEQAFEFFDRVVRQVPWLHIRSDRDDRSDRLTRRFRAVGSFEPVSYRWTFGDGEESPVAAPVHTYHRSGTYTVTLVAALPGGKHSVRRTRIIDVP